MASSSKRVHVLLVAGLGLGAITLTWPGLAKRPPGEPIPVLPVAIAVADEEVQEPASSERRPVRDRVWLDAQLANATRLFGAHGVHFRGVSSRTLDPRYARIETRGDRDALAAELEKGVINVFVVASLRDVDDPSLHRMGVHWRHSKQLAKHYVILAADAQPTTLAHELGHFFGNGHSTVVNNLMSYVRTGQDVFLDEKQAKKIRALSRMYVRSKELVPTPP